MSENQNIPAIEMRGVSVAAMRDASFTVVEDVNWSVAAGEFWVDRRAGTFRQKRFADAGRRADAAGRRQLQTVRKRHEKFRRGGTGRAVARGICFSRRTAFQPVDDCRKCRAAVALPKKSDAGRGGAGSERRCWN